MGKVQNKKSKFRGSNEWKNFRNKMKNEHNKDFITGRPLLKGWNLHHLDLDGEHYEDINNEDNFICLNKTSHKVLHWLYRYKNWREVLYNIHLALERMERINGR